MEKISGNLVDIINKQIYKAEIEINNGVIEKITKVAHCSDIYILPGIVDSHVHIESSMLVPQQFAKLSVCHGTVATVSDPHEIANVLGKEGLNFMLEDAKQSPFKFYFGVPSCVPATDFETSGYTLNVNDIEELISSKNYLYLSEMMNFPGVVYNDENVHKKLVAANKANKPIDGHAPGLKGEQLKKYVEAGISTDHECVTIDEAREKVKLGMKILIREGSAAKNFEILIPLIEEYPDKIMLCTDDCHPDDLIEKHILDLIRRGLKKGYDIFDLFRSANLNPKVHYGLNVGTLQVGEPADFFIANSIDELKVMATYINGIKVYDGKNTLIKETKISPVNNFKCKPISIDDISLKADGKQAKAIIAIDGDLYTGTELVLPKVFNHSIISDTENDILKIVVVNRYKVEKPVVGLIRNFGLKKGAIAGSIAHDSHNIIAVGVSDEDITGAINKVIESKGGIVAKFSSEILHLPLPVAGLMSDDAGEIVADKYKKLNEMPKKWGSKLHAPFMTLSFMALLVIPELKIGDKGLFDGKEFKFTSLFV